MKPLSTSTVTTNVISMYFCKDKPGKEGILAHCDDHYISRVIPYAPSAPNQTQSADITHSLVLEMSSDLLGTGRHLCGDRFYSSIRKAEALHKQNVTYVGNIMPNHAGLPTQSKSVKDRQLEWSDFIWNKESPVMAVSYHPKKGKNVLLISTQHDMTAQRFRCYFVLQKNMTENSNDIFIYPS